MDPDILVSSLSHQEVPKIAAPAATYARINAHTLKTVRGTVQADILKKDQAENTCIFNTECAQLIINRELGLDFCENPWQGSFIVDALTDLIERRGVLGAMDTMHQRRKIQEESLYYQQKKHDDSLPLIGANTYRPKDHGGEITTSIELIRSTGGIGEICRVPSSLEFPSPLIEQNMSNVNIRRAVENIKAQTTIYTPIVEVVVNAIQAIDARGHLGRVRIMLTRQGQPDMDGSLPEISSIRVEDDGVGFNDVNRNSFDTLYTDLKLAEGGKGFGRFICLKYFEDLRVDSVYIDKESTHRRTFRMGKEQEIIVGEKIEQIPTREPGTIVELSEVRKGKSIEKRLGTFARTLTEKLLPYFITQDYSPPRISVVDADDTELVLNDFLNNEISGGIREITVNDSSFTLESLAGPEMFSVRVFKIYAPRNHKSRISLVAHRREVTGNPIHKYIPEFIDEFYDKAEDASDSDKNYILKAYVFGQYLDRNVSLERAGFDFSADSDTLLGISQSQIEAEASRIANSALGSQISARQEKKRIRVQKYADEQAPWHKSILPTVNLSNLSYNANEEEVEIFLQSHKFQEEVKIKKSINQILASSNIADLQQKVEEVVASISGTSKNDLVHYISLRKNILSLLKRSLEVNADGKYSSEGLVHDIIFPRKGDTEKTPFEDHNLWIIDERLNFSSYVSSDRPLEKIDPERPDLIVYDRQVLFREENEPSNPVTIFELKRPQRDDFVNPSSNEDPVQQLIRYANRIRDGKYTTPQGRQIRVADNTPFYGYVICDITPKVESWLVREKNFKPMPDRLGWFQWNENINLYIEVLSWDKLLRDSNLRNSIFFHKLGI